MADIALQMYTMRNCMADEKQLLETLRRVREIGYRSVQITRPAYVTIEALKRMLDECGLSADSALGHCMKLDEEYDAILHEAEVLGTRVVRLDGIPMELAQTAEGYRTFARILEKGGKAFRAAGYDMYYHFHAFEWTNFGAERGIDILLNETTPEYVGFQPDVFWLTSAGTEPSSSLRLFAGRARYMHVKDYAIKPRTGALEDVPNCFAPVGRGNLNWPGIMKTAREIGIDHFVVEQDLCDGDVFECIKTSHDSLRAMLG
ncbi:MAG: sugar phosphate isomerase/epimerase [Clostridiales bacterium]|nr:sugar phosphate isomerase/epimerase [Clostridiales bacterium]